MFPLNGKSVYNSVLSFPVRDESGSFYYFLDESGFSTRLLLKIS